MLDHIYPIPFTKEIIQESKYTAYINDILPKLEKILSLESINKKWPVDLRTKPELLQTLRMGWNKKIHIDGSPLTHTKEYNSEHAIDFLVPIGTPVQAIDDGKIIYLVDQFNEYGIQAEYGEKCNVVSILHENTTMSEYIHLDQYSPSIQGLEVGNYIKKGQILGYTGTSGRMDLPHLHFALYQKFKNTYKNIPIYF
ncbi:MAG: M23 family metallopeptidase [Candidatus Absconditabacteria bacterium]